MRRKLIVFQKKKNKLFGINAPFWIQSNSEFSKLWIHYKYFFTILHIERDQEAHENHINYIF